MTDRTGNTGPDRIPANAPGDEVSTPRMHGGGLPDGRIVFHLENVADRRDLSHRDLTSNDQALSNFDRALTELQGTFFSDRQDEPSPPFSTPPVPAPSTGTSGMEKAMAIMTVLSPETTQVLKEMIRPYSECDPDALLMLAYSFSSESEAAGLKPENIENALLSAVQNAVVVYDEILATVRASLVGMSVPENKLDEAIASAAKKVVFDLISNSFADGREEDALRQAVAEIGSSNNAQTSSRSNHSQSRETIDLDAPLGEFPEGLRNAYISNEITKCMEAKLGDYPDDLARALVIEAAQIVRHTVNEYPAIKAAHLPVTVEAAFRLAKLNMGM